MGKHIGLSLLIIFLLFFIPWLWAPDAPADSEEPPPPAAGDPPEQEPPQEPETPAGLDAARTLRVKIGDVLQEMDFAAYLTGVVRAEMPASFELEALKAQAAAARTYVIHKMRNGGSPNHPEADACDDITCCQAYLSQAVNKVNQQEYL